MSSFIERSTCYFGKYVTAPRNIKDNISDEILMNYEKGHSNQFYYSFELVDDSEYQDSLI